jgi:hypothetical protein
MEVKNKTAKELLESGLDAEKVSSIIQEFYDNSNSENHEEIEEEHGEDADPDDYWTEDHIFDMAHEAALSDTIKAFKIRYTDLSDILDGGIASFNINDTYENRISELSKKEQDKKTTLMISNNNNSIFRRNEFYRYFSYLKVSEDNLLN